MQVTLNEILEAREARVRTQQELLQKHCAPLVCFTMNIAGPVKTTPVIERAFVEGLRQIEAVLAACEVRERREEHAKCGPVAFWAVNGDAAFLKKKMIKIEETHPVGRLFDIDVLAADGKKASRPRERGCIVCGAPGRACAAGRLHPVSEITAVTARMMRDYFLDLDTKRVAFLAKNSLLQEVHTAPKPGLVDPTSRGSHTDMDVAAFARSAEALEPYFQKCAQTGAIFRDEPSETLFLRLRALGIEAERSMYAVTGGVNTHKGAIFSMGLLTAAIGKLLSPDGCLPSTDKILEEAASIARPAIERDLKNANGSTAGERAFLERGARGIRGEVQDGFPSVKKIAIPAYRKALRKGKSKNDAGVLALLHLIANVYDTNLYKRGGEAGVLYAQERARALLAVGDPAPQALQQMDADLSARNLSPGGCADLLAITYFLTELESQRNAIKGVTTLL